MEGRRTEHALAMLKQKVIEDHIAKRLTTMQAAGLLVMHPKSFLRLKGRYLHEGFAALVGKKPGPKMGTRVMNRTPEHDENLVVSIATDHPLLGPIPLAELLDAEHGLVLHPTTIWRILKRKGTRYDFSRKRWKEKPTLYALEEPGAEVQMDACYPFGRAKKLAVFDAVDDCSRFLTAKAYEREDLPSAKDFLRHLVCSAPFRIQAVRLDNRFNGKELRSVAERLRVHLIFNEAYHPEQNGKVERYHRTFKREAIGTTIFFPDSLQTTNYKLSLWVGHYNTRRRHGGLKMHRMTPSEKLGAVYLSKSLATSMTFPHLVTGSLQQYIF
jgi:transposase InsO family protein